MSINELWSMVGRVYVRLCHQEVLPTELRLSFKRQSLVADFLKASTCRKFDGKSAVVIFL